MEVDDDQVLVGLFRLLVPGWSYVSGYIQIHMPAGFYTFTGMNFYILVV